MKKPRNPAPRTAIAEEPEAPEWRKRLLPIAVLWAITLLAYSSSFQGGLIFDSASRVLQDSRVHAATAENVSLIFRSDYWYPSLGSGLYRPVTTLSLLFNYAVLGNGAQPFGYHLFNWMLHATSASMVYFLALLIFGKVAPAFATAALWSVHPVLSESVTNVVGRADILAAIGLLGGLLCYVKATKAIERRWLWLACAAAAVTVGIFSKESTVVVFGVVAMYELAFGNATWRARAAGLAALALPCAIYWLLRIQAFAQAPPMHIPFTDNPMSGAGFFVARWTAVKVIGKEMLLLLWPAKLSADYSYNQISLSSWGDPGAWGALLACLAAAGVAVWGFRKSRPLFFWIGFFFLTLAPTANLAIVIGTPMAERFLYLPAIGFAGCVVTALWRAPSRMFQVAAAILCIALGARTYARNFDWKDDASLWSSARAASPNSYKTHLFSATGKLPDALRELDAAIAIVNDLPDEINTPMPFIEGGRRYRENGDTLRSQESYRKSLDLLLRGERIQRAHNLRIQRQQESTGGATFGASWSPVYAELGRTYTRLGEFGKAAEAIRTGLKGRFSAEDFEQLSVAYFKMGDRRQAAIALLEGLVAEPKNRKIASEAVSLYSQIDPNGCAVQSVNGAQALNLECPVVHEHLCAASAEVAQLHREGGRVGAAEQVARGFAQSLKCGGERR